MSGDRFTLELSRSLWDAKYRYYRDGAAQEASIEESWRRIATALAAVESSGPWQQTFFDALSDFRFLPGGRIQAGAGTSHNVTLFNCFVMGIIEDSVEGIFDALKEGAKTMHAGGGVGYDFSTLRPRGAVAHTSGAIASGPVSFMHIWDSTCATILSTGARRGAMMGTLRCDHPDIFELVAAKADAKTLRNFNISVQVPDVFMRTVAEDGDWPLVFPKDTTEPSPMGEYVMRHWSGRVGPVECAVLRRVRARELWRHIMRATYDYAEPGVLFVDTVNRNNNLWYREHITTTNPCGEIPLPPYGACNLGAINLTRLVRDPFSSAASLAWQDLADLVHVAVRMLDDVVEVSRYPLTAQREQAQGARRLGLGVTGLADALVMLGLRYDSPEARELAGLVMRRIREEAYRTSVALARERGSFAFFERDRYLAGPFVAALPADLRDAIAKDGIRNSHLLTIAPTGTISLLADNVSSGIEPVVALRYARRILERDGSRREHQLEPWSLRQWRALGNRGLPTAMQTQEEIDPEAQIAMQATLQRFVDNAISKTISVAEDFSFARFERLYELAWREGLKGCTTFRPNPVTGAVLSAGPAAGGCCSVEREAD